MPAIAEITYSQFLSSLRGNPFFFWLENDEAFVLLKPMQGVFIKTVLKKSGDENDVLARDKIVSREGAVKAEKIEGFEVNEKLDKIIQLLEQFSTQLYGGELSGRVQEGRRKTV